MKSEMVLWQTSHDLGRVWATTDVQKSARSFLSDPCVIYKQGSSVQQLYKIRHDKMPKSYLPNGYYRDPGRNKSVFINLVCLFRIVSVGVCVHKYFCKVYMLLSMQYI